jgi:FolB domain-containing protein
MTLETGGWLCVHGIEVQCTIGVTERERRVKRRLVINLKFKVDFAKVAMSDAIQDSVDYRSVSKRVVAECEKSSFRLIETLASHVCRTILAEFVEVDSVAVEVWKPGALSAAKSVGAMVISNRGQKHNDL